MFADTTLKVYYTPSNRWGNPIRVESKQTIISWYDVIFDEDN